MSIVVLVTLTIASDFAWRRSAYDGYSGHYVEGTLCLFTPFQSPPRADVPLPLAAFFALGIMTGKRDKKTGLFFYVIANAFLKLFIVVLYMHQSFWGLSGGSHPYPYVYCSLTRETSSESKR